MQLKIDTIQAAVGHIMPGGYQEITI
jgi:hypothetical protein